MCANAFAASVEITKAEQSIDNIKAAQHRAAAFFKVNFNLYPINLPLTTTPQYIEKISGVGAKRLNKRAVPLSSC